jgi:hypothetical protein
VVERFNRTLKEIMWKRFTAENTRNWIEMLDKLLHEYNNRRHSTIGMTPVKASLKENEMKVIQTAPITYIIKDSLGEVIQGSFYNEELQKTSQEIYRIEKVIRKKKIDGVEHAFVKWNGYSTKHNQWIPVSQLEKIK